MNDIKSFAEKLSYSFKDLSLLRNVFLHSSFLNESSGEETESNERLEFLGDALLSGVVSHMLFSSFSDLDEGGLTSLRSRLVDRQTLAGLAARLDLGCYLLMGKGEEKGGGRENPSILADTFEALVAAIYLDSGRDFDVLYNFLGEYFRPLMEEATSEPASSGYKPRLQELTQATLGALPVYELVSETGPAHDKVFEVTVSVDGKVLARASAKRKKDAEQLAAREALLGLESTEPPGKTGA